MLETETTCADECVFGKQKTLDMRTYTHRRQTWLAHTSLSLHVRVISVCFAMNASRREASLHATYKTARMLTHHVCSNFTTICGIFFHLCAHVYDFQADPHIKNESQRSCLQITGKLELTDQSSSVVAEP